MPYVPRSMLAQQFQMGPEPTATPGVGGTSNLRFPTLNYTLVPAGGNAQQSRHAGGKYVGSVIMGDLWTEGTFNGNADFNELAVIGTGNINNPTPTAAGAAITRIFQPNPDGTDNTATFKAQKGVAGAADNYPYTMIPDLGLRFARDAATTLTSRALGKTGTPGTTLDTAVSLAQAPFVSTRTGLYTGTTLATALNTRLDPYGFVLEWHNNGKFAAWFPLDDSVVSFGGATEAAVDCGGTISIAWDVNDAGTDLRGPFNYTSLKEGTVLFFGAKTTGGIIPTTAIRYAANLAICAQISGPPREATFGSLKAYEYPFICVPDPVSNAPFILTVVSSVTAGQTTPP
jgi:hypothetical protein